MSRDELAFATAAEVAAEISARRVSSEEVTRAALQRIAQIDGELRSFVTVDTDGAIATARAADAAPQVGRGPFHGVPIAIKDNAETAGLRTTYSSRCYRDNVPERDSAAVARLRRAGFIVLGKTNMPELGTLPVTESELNGACRNPWNLELTPGGSSGGSAAAVAAGLVPVAHGTDGAGSIRIPASCCGLVGLKPSRGRISWAPGHGDFLGGLATQAIVARTVADSAATTAVMCGYEAGDPSWLETDAAALAAASDRAPEPLTVAVTLRAPNDAEVDGRCVAAVRAAADLLADLGHDVREGAPDWHDHAAINGFAVMARTITAYYDDIDVDLLEPVNRALTEAGERASSIEYARAVVEGQRYARRVAAFWDDVDVVLTPTLALPPVRIGWVAEEPDPVARFARIAAFSPFTMMANLTGQPAISLPLHQEDGGPPIGVQLIGGPAGDVPLLRLAAQLEWARPWAQRRPSAP